jgi:hypothetical protein
MDSILQENQSHTMSQFKPFQRMLERIALDKADSNSAFFTSLLYGYEFVTKLTSAAFVAAVDDDSDRHRYRIEYRLVRASGVGDWASVINEVFTGPPSSHLSSDAKSYRNEFLEKVSEGDWRFQATSLLRDALVQLEIETEPQPKKAQLLQWFRDFALLRNKTRGHGATSQSRVDRSCEALEESLHLVMSNLGLFKIPWAFIRRNLSNKYRVCCFGADESAFAHLRSQKDLSYEDGVYIFIGNMRLCRLVQSDQDLSDYFVANGGFTDTKYEQVSYISGETQYGNSNQYLRPADHLPGSATDGKGQLDVVGKAFANLPELPSGYINREGLQNQVRDELLATTHHPIVTLDGRGGIGKTSVALHVIWNLVESDQCPFDVVIWFSARDIDLLPEGAKIVRPSGVTLDDFANQYAALLEATDRKSGKFNSKEFFAKSLSGGDDARTLFVFDNFETVVNPAETFSWLDNHVRLPNKVLITTRIRGNFKADFPIHIDGMNDEECEALVDATAERLGIRKRIDAAFRSSIVAESEGHPYVVKVLLGEVLRSPGKKSISRVIAGREDILEALFDRTYDALTPAARRVFLTIAGWRSIIPELAVEAVLIRPGNEKLDIREALQELVNSSLVDEIEAGNNEYFLSVPLAAQVFGQKKLASSPYRGSITEDIKLLQQFGAAQRHDVAQGLEKRLNVLFRNISLLVKTGDRKLEEFMPIIEYVARKVPKAWLYLADLCEECGVNADEYVRNCLLRYLERDGKDDSRAWKRAADMFGKANQVHDEINALVGLAKSKDVATYLVSNAVNRVNSLLKASPSSLDQSDRIQLARELAETLDRRRNECTATDLSRLAWLYLTLQETEKAKEVVLIGLQESPDNTHCQNLLQRLESNQ